MKVCWYWLRWRCRRNVGIGKGAGPRRGRAVVPQMHALPFGRRRRAQQGRPGAQRPRRPQVRHHRGLQLQRSQQEGRHHLERGDASRTTSRTRWPRCRAPRWPSPASRTKRKSPTCGAISSSSRPTAVNNSAYSIDLRNSARPVRAEPFCASRVIAATVGPVAACRANALTRWLNRRRVFCSARPERSAV